MADMLPVKLTDLGDGQGKLEDFAAGDTIPAEYLESTSDLLSTLRSAEVSITGATTLTGTAFGKMHLCTGTSADYTVGLPAASGNAGKFIGLRMSPALTTLVTLDGNASELIDGATTRILRVHEVVLLLCDGTAWSVVFYKANPFRFTAVKTSNQSAAAGVFTKVTFSSEEYDFGDSFDLPNSRSVCKRAGVYAIAGNVAMALTASGDNASFRIYKNGAQVRYPAYATTSISTIVGMAGAVQLSLAVGDVIEFYVYNGAPAARDVTGNALGATIFSATEVI